METLPRHDLPSRASFERYGGGQASIESLAEDHISEADIARMVEICNQPKVHTWVTGRYATGPGGIYTEEDARAFVDTARQDWASKKGFPFVIRDENGQLVGTIGLRSADKEEPEVGYWADTEGTSGYVTNALLALCDLAEEAGYSRLCAYAMPGNDSSRGVLARAGFDEGGLTPYTTGGDDLTVEAVRYVKNLH